jgi:hypothetical protein
MQRRALALFLAPLVFVIASCQGKGSTTDPIQEMPAQAGPLVVEGTVTAWTRGAGTITPRLGVLEGAKTALATGSIDASGDFSFTLPDGSSMDAHTDTAYMDWLCSNGPSRTGRIEATPEGARVAAVGLIRFTPKGAASSTGFISHNTSDGLNHQPGDIAIAYVYSEGAVQLKGSCDDPWTQMFFDLDLKPGWNTVLGTVTGNEEKLSFDLVAGPVPTNTHWYYNQYPE